MSKKDNTGLPPPTADNGVAPSLWGAFLGSVEVEQHPWSPPTQYPGVTTTDVPRHGPVPLGEGWVRTPQESPHIHTSFLKFAVKDKKGP